MTSIVLSKPSNLEQLRAQARQQNLIDSGDLEPGVEFQDTHAEADKPRFIQFRTAGERENFERQRRLDFLTRAFHSEGQINREEMMDNQAWRVEVKGSQVEIGGVGSLEFSAGKDAVAEAERIAGVGSEVSSVVTPGVEKDNFLKDYAPEINFGLLFGVLVKGGKELFGAAIKGFKENVTFKERLNQADMTPEQIKAKEDEAKRKKIISQNADRIAQAQGMPGVEMQRAQQEEDKQVNLMTKIQAGFRGLRLFDKLRPYYEALFKRGQLEEAERQKKAEKQISFAQATQQGKITADLDAGIEGGTGRGIVSVTGPNASAG